MSTPTSQLPSLLKEPQLPTAGVSSALPAAPEVYAAGPVTTLPDTKKIRRALEWVAAVGRCVERGVTFEIPEEGLKAEMKGYVETIAGIDAFLAQVDQGSGEIQNELKLALRHIKGLEQQVATLQQSLADARRAPTRTTPKHQPESTHATEENQSGPSARTDLEPDLQRLRARRADPARVAASGAGAGALGDAGADIWADG